MSTLHAQTTIVYTNGQTDPGAYSTNPDGLILSIASGSAVQSGVLSGNNSVEKVGLGTLTLTGTNIYTASDSAFNGTVVSGGTLQVSGVGAAISHATRDLIVGNAALEIINGATVTSRAAAINGTGFTPGSALISGTDSTWTSGTMFVGTSGQGSLSVQSGGLAQINSNLFIGDQAGSTGTVTVSGATLNATQSIFVGNFGTGTLNISAGSQVQTGSSSFIGASAGSTGTVNVSGASTIWNTGNLLAVGSLGNGTLNITGGAVVNSAGNTFVGLNGVSTGAATVSGAGSRLNSSGLVSIGDGTMTVSNGGGISGTSGFLGSRGGATGTLVVTGAGAKADFSQLLAVGNSGTGSLQILAGGKVTSVGNSSVNANGSVSISGTGSSWINNGDLAVRNDATLTISNGGLLQNTRSFVVDGNIIVTGTNSLWHNTSEVALGQGSGSTGILTVANGGTVSSDAGLVAGGGSIYLGYGGGGVGVLNIGADGDSVAQGAGTVQAAVISSGFSGSDSGVINFNHTSNDYVFAPQIVRQLSVAQFGGTTTLTGNNSYDQDTTVYGGTLKVGSDHALGQSKVYVGVDPDRTATLEVNSGVTLTNATDPISVFSNGTLLNNGTMESGGMDMLVSVESSGGTVVNNGTMHSDSVVVYSGVGISASVTNNGIMQVSGAVPGDPAIGVWTGTVVNNVSGQILSDSSGIYMGDNLGTVVNHGLINAQGTSFISMAGLGVMMQGGGTVTNTGTIIGKNVGVMSIGALTLVNSGLIQGQNRPSVFALGGATISNLTGGEIRGGSGLLAVSSLLGPTTLNNAGLISGNVLLGPTQVNTVTLYTGGVITGALVVGPNAGSQLILDGAGSSTFSNAVGGVLGFAGGTLTKQGTGTWVLDQAMPYAGDTIINAGKLVLNGSVIGNVQLNGGTLGGNGFIGGNLFNNGGVVNVGSSPGIMNIGGSFVQGPGGNFVVEAAGTALGQFDQLNAGMNASLNGTLTLQILPGYVPHVGDTFNFLTVGGVVTGQFSNFVTNLNGALKGSLAYDGSGLPYITIVQGLYTAFAQTPNQRSVAANIDTFSTTGQSPALINLLNGLPGAALPSAYDQISPDEYGAMSRPILSYNATQQSNLQRRFADLRAGSTGFTANGFTLMGFDRSLLLAGGGDAMAAQIATNPDKSPMRIAKDNKWGFFVNGSGQFGDMQSDGNGVGYDFTTGGINIGMDYRLSESLVVGGSLGYANSSTDTDANGGSIQANNAKALLYASWFNKGFYVNGAAGGGGTSYDTKRNVLGNQVSGSTSGGDFTTFLGGGYDFKMGSLTIGPAVSLGYSYVNVGGFTEQGGIAPLQIQDQNFDSLQSRLGLLASYPVEVGGVRVNPTLNAAWQHEFLDTAQTVSARFANGSGGIFGVQSAEAERDSAILGLGVDVEWTPTISTYLSYDAEAADRFLAQTVSGGVKFKF